MTVDASSWMAPESSWQAKLDRAWQHLVSLEGQLGNFRSSRPWSVTPEPTETPGRIAHRLRYTQMQPVGISTTIGDVLHNQRAALESLAYELARRSQGGTLGKRQAGNTTFPICRNPGAFERFCDEAGSLYSTQAKRALREVQPFVHMESSIALGVGSPSDYQTRFHWSLLHRLDRLWNIDKHRRVTVTEWWPDIIYWASNWASKRVAFRGDGTLEDGSILIYTQGEDEGQGADLNYQFNLTLKDDPAYTGDDQGSTEDVLKLLNRFQEHIRFSIFGRIISIMSTPERTE